MVGSSSSDCSTTGTQNSSQDSLSTLNDVSHNAVPDGASIMPVDVDEDVDEDEAFERACRIWFEAPHRAAIELSQLSKTERERVWADMTGSDEISNFAVPKEDPLIIQQQFKELHGDLHQYKSKHQMTSALGCVLTANSDYVCNPRCMVKYLRATDYSVKSSMALMVRHFEMKERLFGRSVLARDITLSDLDSHDMKFLTHGAYQYLAGTDRAGRSITFWNFADPIYSGNKEQQVNVLRAMFYRNIVATELDSIQRLGIVRALYFHRCYPHGGVDNELLRRSVGIIEAVPIRSVSFYLVSGSTLWSQTLDLVIMLASPFLRVRTRIVSGSFLENLYALLCLGVPKSSFPAREDGRIMSDNLMAWVEERRIIEEARENANGGDDTPMVDY